MGMIYHICPNFDSFVKNAIDRFEKIKPGSNRCIELYDKFPISTNMKIKDLEGYIFYSYSYKDPNWIKILMNDCSGVIIHNLQNYMLDPLLCLPKNIKKYFRSYGGDIFDLIYDADQDFYLPRTQELISKLLPEYLKIIRSFNKLYCKLVPHKRGWERIRDKKKIFLKQLFAMSTSCPYEFDMIRNRQPDLNLSYLHFSYIPVSVRDNKNKNNIAKVNIMVGHSNSAGQNHIDTFQLIKNFNLQGLIITPLSYITSQYTKAVIKEGYRLLNDKFRPLTTFLAEADYNNILSSCYAFIESSLYQQGLGNIIFLLRRGSNVYLPKENPIYIFCKNAGINIFSIENDLNENHLNNYRLNQYEINMNNNLLDTYFSAEKDDDTAKTIINNFK
jgi:dTDP-N-acetylfucosamine:lipid II N-acetylfucosaminyltransferase